MRNTATLTMSLKSDCTTFTITKQLGTVNKSDIYINITFVDITFVRVWKNIPVRIPRFLYSDNDMTGSQHPIVYTERKMVEV